MISAFFHAFFYNPIYNVLVALVALVPGSDVGIAVILITILIRLILLPFSISQARTQRAMKVLEPKIKELKEKYKNDREREAIETLALYRESQINPFATLLISLIQIPILLALYWVFCYEPFPIINMARVYSFTPLPHAASLQFLWITSIASKSFILAVLAGLTQFIQATMALKGTMSPAQSTVQGDFQKSMNISLKYLFPFLIASISYTTSAAVALYFITTNIAGSVQELHMRRVIAAETKQLEAVA